MLTVFKYPLAVVDEQSITMPLGAEPLTVQMQHNVPCLWARVDTDAPMVPRRFWVRGTGHPEAMGRYVATFQMGGGALVFHVFEAP